MKKLFFAAICMAFGRLLVAQGDLNEVRPISSKLLLQNVQLVTHEATLEDQDIFIENGLIIEVGPDLAVPADAKIINAAGHYAYPGFIAGLTSFGYAAPKKESYKATDPGNPDPRMVGINPDRSVTDHLNVTHKDVKAMKKLGFTTLHVAPNKGMLPGQGAVISLCDTTGVKSIQKANVSMMATFQGSGQWRTAPATAIGVVAKLKDLYKQAAQRMAYEDRYKENAAAMERMEKSSLHASLYPVLKEEKAFYFHAPMTNNVQRVMDLKDNLGFPVVLANVQQVEPIMDKIKAENIMVLASVKLPKEMPAEKKEVKMDETNEKRKKKEKAEEVKKEKPSDLSPDELAYQKRQRETLLAREANAAKLAEKEIPFAFSFEGVKTKDIKPNLLRMHKAGLSKSDILKALTTDAAKILGIEHTSGSVEAGKLANILITDKPYFDDAAKVTHVIAEGTVEMYNDEKSNKKKDNETK